MNLGTNKKRLLIVAGIVAVVSVGVLFVLYRAWDHPVSPAVEPPKTKVPALPVEPPQTGPHLLVTHVDGRAERLRTRSAAWAAVQVGDELFSEDKLRTDKNAAVRLAVDDKSHFELAGRSELNVRELTETLHQFELALGRIRVDYEPYENRILKITASDEGDATAETAAAKFVVQRTGNAVTVATQMGKVKLTAKADTVEVGPNTYSRILKGRAPAKPEPIPLEVLLKVAAPRKGTEKDRTTIISGTSNIGAMVFIDDEEAAVDEVGAFRLTLQRKPGLRHINVVSTTAWGAAEKDVAIFSVPDDGKLKDATVKWGKSLPENPKDPKTKGPN